MNADESKVEPLFYLRESAAQLLTDERIRSAARRLYADAPAVPRFMAVHRASIAPVAGVLNAVPANSRVLDVGCGNGLLLNVLADAGRIAAGEGVDISAAAVAIANAAAGRLAANVARSTFAARPPETLLPAGEFDVVLLVDVMHHVPPAVQEDFLRRVSQRVNPGGLLVYKDMCRRPRWRATMNRLHDAVMARQWIQYFPIDRVPAVIGAAFEVIESRDVGMLWYGHELRVFRRAR